MHVLEIWKRGNEELFRLIIIIIGMHAFHCSDSNNQPTKFLGGSFPEFLTQTYIEIDIY